MMQLMLFFSLLVSLVGVLWATLPVWGKLISWSVMYALQHHTSKGL